jgi:hypothetical protein
VDGEFMLSDAGGRVLAPITAGDWPKVTDAEIANNSFIRAYNADAWHLLHHRFRHGRSVRANLFLQFHEKDIPLNLVGRRPK